MPMADPLTGPDKPGWLDPVAAEAWDAMLALLLERRVLSRADGTAMALLCTTYAEWRRAAEGLVRDGPSVATSTGGFKPSPELQAVDRIGKQLLALLREFGMTPSSRHGVAPIVDVSRDPLAEFLDGRPGAGGGPIAGRI
jgi:P27 family predicted phage terminase small subunit